MSRSDAYLLVTAIFIPLLIATPCNAQTGACCFEDCTCMVIPEAYCAGLGGAHWIAGETCDPDPCGEWLDPCGACCFENSACQTMTEEQCSQGGGIYWLEGEDCGGYPCGPPTGACCLPPVWLECVYNLEEGCLDQGGIWQEYDICDPNWCMPWVACCLPGGECVYVDGNTCVYDLGGVSQPVGVLCDPYPCPVPCACCFPDGLCEMYTLEECTALDGEFMGGQSICDPNPCGVAGVADEPRVQTTWGRVKATYR